MDSTVALLLFLTFGLCALLVIVLAGTVVLLLRALTAGGRVQSVAQRRAVAAPPATQPAVAQAVQRPTVPSQRFTAPPPAPGPSLQIDATTGQMRVEQDTSALLEDHWQDVQHPSRDH